MSQPIGKGDWVEYIGPTHPAAFSHNLLTIGAVYYVEGIDCGFGVDGDLYDGLCLVGFDGWVFAPTSFRPLGGQKHSDSLKQPAPERESEPA